MREDNKRCETIMNDAMRYDNEGKVMRR